MVQEYFIDAVREGDIEEVSDLLEVPEVEPSAEGNEAGRIAFEDGKEELLEAICGSNKFAAGDDFDDLAVEAVVKSSSNKLKILLDVVKVNPNLNNGVLIRSACKIGDEASVKALLKDPRTNPNICHSAPTRIAGIYGHSTLVELLKEDIRVSSYTEE